MSIESMINIFIGSKFKLADLNRELDISNKYYKRFHLLHSDSKLRERSPSFLSFIKKRFIYTALFKLLHRHLLNRWHHRELQGRLGSQTIRTSIIPFLKKRTKEETKKSISKVFRELNTHRLHVMPLDLTVFS